MVDRPEALVDALVALVREAGGAVEPSEMQAVLTEAIEAAAPAGPRDLTPHEILRIRLSKAVARTTPAAVYRDRDTRRRLRRTVAELLEAHGVPRVDLRLADV